MEQYIAYLENLLEINNISYQKLQNQEQQLQMKELSYDHINRYKRQMVLREISMEGQLKIQKSRVLIVGAGGIGAPAALYLAGAGIGTLGIMDGDVVEISNLHRQIIHTTQRIGINKAQSAKIQLNSFNQLIKVITHETFLTTLNAKEIFQNYDIILDATDNPATRYLINDVAIALNKPLVSGSSVGWEGQITVYGMNGPCYRCLFPQCPKNVSNCNEAGVFGVMPGIIGLCEALQTVKIIIGQPHLSQKMVIIDGLRDTFKVCKLRGQSKDCLICQKQFDFTQFDYQEFAGIICSIPVQFKGGYKEIEWKEYFQLQKDEKCDLMIDVRPSVQFNILKIDKFLNVPYQDIDEFKLPEDCKKMFIMCRRGNNSRLACEIFSKLYKIDIYNIVGGIESYAKQFDVNMPLL